MNGHVAEYREKCVSADEAMKAVRSGDWIEYSWAASQACLLDEALAKRTEVLHDVNFRGAVLMKPMAGFERDPKGEHFTWNSWHAGGLERKMMKPAASSASDVYKSQVSQSSGETQRIE